MIFLELLSGVIAIFIGLFFLTQVVVPLLFSTPFFPVFRKPTPIAVEVEIAEHDLEEKTELFRLQKRLFALNQEQAALEKQIAETNTKAVDPK
jgi:hypothetical protein